MATLEIFDPRLCIHWPDTCESCIVNGQTYNVGETYKRDSCSLCKCEKDGTNTKSVCESKCFIEPTECIIVSFANASKLILQLKLN